MARALLSEAAGWRNRSGGAVTESRMLGSAPEVTPACPVLAGGSGFSAGLLLAGRSGLFTGNSLCAS